ncbi:MAG: AMP-binding protein, partial [Hydrogenophaga sp.]
MSTPASSEPAHTRGVTTPALMEITIGQALAQTAERFGAREALVVPHQGVRWTWRELLQRTDALAAGL